MFEVHADKEIAVNMAKYMRNQFSFYGIATPKRREMYKGFLKAEKRKQRIDWDLLHTCYKEECREFQYFVCDYLNTLHPFLTYNDIENVKRCMKVNQWWDTIDCLTKVINHLLLKDERVSDVMLAWSTDEDVWIRRVAIDCQLWSKANTNPELLEKILKYNLGSSEFFIKKAIGWSLREYSKTNPDWVNNFIVMYKDYMNPLSIREASKYI